MALSARRSLRCSALSVAPAWRHASLFIIKSDRCQAAPLAASQAVHTQRRRFFVATTPAHAPVPSGAPSEASPGAGPSAPTSSECGTGGLTSSEHPDTDVPLTVPPQDPWNDLRGLVVTAKLSHPSDVFENRPIAIGRLVERISGRLYRVKLEKPKQSWHAWAVRTTGAAAGEPSSAASAPPTTASAEGHKNVNTPGEASPACAHAPPAASPTTDAMDAQVPRDAAYTRAASTLSTEEERSRLFDSAVPLTLDIGTRVALVYDDDLSLSANVTAATAESDYDVFAAMSMNMEGLVVRVNGNNTYTVLMDNGEVELSVEPHRLLLLPPGKTTSVVHSHMFLDLQAWLRSCIIDVRDCEAAALVLFKRGWRLQRLFLLERGDLAALTFIPHLQREAVIEKAQWERDYYHVVRNLKSERIKDRDYRYAISKYKGTISCIIGILVVSYVFVSNLRAYDRQQRSYQLRVAARAIASGGLQTRLRGGIGAAGEEGHEREAQVVVRPEEEEKMARVFRQLDAAHPRIVVVTGFSGNGKSALCRRVMEQEGLPAVFVHVRGGGEDTLRSIVRSLGVLNVEVCGDLMDFLSEAIREARSIRSSSNVLTRKRRHTTSPRDASSSTPEPTQASITSVSGTSGGNAATTSPSTSASASATAPTITLGWSNDEAHVPLMASAPSALGSSETAGPQTLPIIYVKLMDGSRLETAYKEAVGLVVDHQVCHLIFEVPMESLTAQARRLSRLDFYMVPNFTRSQAFKYLLNVMEPSDMVYFVEVVGTNCNDLDELYAAVRQRGVDAVTYTAQKLMKGMRRLHAAAALFAHRDEKLTAQDVMMSLQQLASVPFDVGRPTKQVPEIMALGNHALFKDILLYDPLRDRWFFSQQVLHTAARCFYCPPPANAA